MKIAIISDIHEDFLSLIQAERIIRKKKCDKVICMGDIVGYSIPFYNYLENRDAANCVKWVRENCSFTVAGNHDLYAVRKVPQSRVGNFTFPEQWYDMPFSKRAAMGKGHVWLYEDNELSPLLDEEELAFLRDLPEKIIADICSFKVLLSHFTYPDLSGSACNFIYGLSDIKHHLNYMHENECDICFSGHMHYNGLAYANTTKFNKIGFNKKTACFDFSFFSLPPITSSAHNNGFIIWDTQNHVIETVSLRRKLKLL